MSKYFSTGIIKILLFYDVAFSGFRSWPAPEYSRQKIQSKFPKKIAAKLQVTDTGKNQGSDTVKLQVNDTLNALATDSLERPLPDSVIYKRTDFSAEELIRGERLFYGLVYLGDKSVNCVSCHNTRVSDTLNWNPDAFEISKKYLDKSAEDLSKVLLKPLGKKMQLVHKDFQLTAEDITLIKAFMNKFAALG